MTTTMMYGYVLLVLVLKVAVERLDGLDEVVEYYLKPLIERRVDQQNEQCYFVVQLFEHHV